MSEKAIKLSEQDNTGTINFNGVFKAMTPITKVALYEIKQKVHEQVLEERKRQNKKWGHQLHSNEKWLAILMEEVGEACQALQKGNFASKATDADNLLEELVQVTAVAHAWTEQVYQQQKTNVDLYDELNLTPRGEDME